MSGNPSDFVRSVTVAITRRADAYVEMLDESRLEGKLPAEEPQLLDQFEQYAIDILDRYVPPGPRRRDSLVFEDLYSATQIPHRKTADVRRSLLCSLRRPS
jgi:hypothetical protein